MMYVRLNRLIMLIFAIFSVVIRRALFYVDYDVPIFGDNDVELAVLARSVPLAQ